MQPQRILEAFDLRILQWNVGGFSQPKRLNLMKSFQNGSVSSDFYCDLIILWHLCLLRDAIGSDYNFVDYNAGSHRTSVAEELLENENTAEVDSDGVQKLLESHKQKLTTNKHVEIHEQDIERAFRPNSIRRSNDD
ncbi:hypothetical protein TNCV_440061 [Trichonephila clavipes]|nr:hypothetical protein TNCV_440061 [Trichonephila clavipes]